MQWDAGITTETWPHESIGNPKHESTATVCAKHAQTAHTRNWAPYPAHETRHREAKKHSAGGGFKDEGVGRESGEEMDERQRRARGDKSVVCAKARPKRCEISARVRININW